MSKETSPLLLGRFEMVEMGMIVTPHSSAPTLWSPSCLATYTASKHHGLLHMPTNLFSELFLEYLKGTRVIRLYIHTVLIVA